jgi:ABC-type transport system involved in multi-copper enzyme maturation permease subunit
MTLWEWAGIAAGAALAAVLFAVALWLRGRRSPVVGPLFWYEMVVLARRGQQPRLRALLVGLLLVGLFVTYLREFRGQELAALTGGARLDQSARFANAFLTAFLIAQLLAVVLITPAVVGGAMTEEKERGTLDFLRSSLLTNREIVLGKLAARLAFVGGVVLAGLPVLALTSLFGGVDLNVLLAGYAITAVSAVSLGAFSLWLGVIRDTLRDVLVWAYVVTAGLSVFGSCCGCIPGVAAVSPPSALGWMFLHPLALPSQPQFWVNLGVFTALHGTAAAVFCFLAVARVRSAPPVRRPPSRRARPLRAGPVAPAPLPVARRLPDAEEDDPDDDEWDGPPLSAGRAFAVPRLGDGDPLVWKERYFSGRLSWAEGGAVAGCGIAALSVVGFILGMTLFFSALHEVNRGRWIGEAVNPVARLFLTGAVVLTGLALGARAAGAVARERQKRTLDGLLTLPVERAELLRAKWIALFLWAKWALTAAAAGAGFALVTGGVHPLGFAVWAVQAVGWLTLAATMGLWLSVTCRTATRATVHFIVWVLALWLGPLVLMPLVVAVWGGAGEVVSALSLPVGQWQGLFGWQEFAEGTAGLYAGNWRQTRWAAGLAGVGYAAAAAALWFDAARRFEREGR